MSETLWKLVPETAADQLEVGDRVTVSPSYRFYEDWKGVEAEVVSVYMNSLRNRGYTVSEDWPKDGGFDGWAEGELVRISDRPTAPAGLYRQHECGKVERVEVDVVGALRPFVSLMERHERRYRERGGDPDAFPDTHPAFDIRPIDLRVGVWRKLRAVLQALGDS